ncbi:MAG: formylglycine-generating enzyme family protein [Saprospiraceae bacterium]|nr:formylglycine-generating enzyme family protein [Saprospiraceae bacterium]
MPLPKPFADILREAEDLLARDLPGAIAYLRGVLPPASPRQDELLLLLARYNDARALSVAGAADTREISVLENAVRRELLLLVRDLKASEWDAPAAPNTQDKSSNLLYRIPRAMPLGLETLCVVRIATDPGVLVQDFTVDVYTEQRRLKKISKSMLVELSDPSGGRHFGIRPDSRSTQTIDLDGEEYTQWKIYVTPLLPGEHTLELKVCVVEIVDGEKEVRERVLEEHVQVLADGASRGPADVPEKQAGPALAFAGAPDPAEAETYYRPPAPQSVPPPPPPPIGRRPGGQGLRTAALFLAFLLVGTSVGWALTPPVTRDWWIASIQNSEAAYARFIEEHDDNPKYCEKAYYRRAMLSEDPAIVRSYLTYVKEKYDEAPPDEHKKAVWGKLDQLAQQSLDELQQQPDAPRIEQFLQTFPEPKYQEKLQMLGEQRPEWQPVIRESIEKRKSEDQLPPLPGNRLDGPLRDNLPDGPIDTPAGEGRRPDPGSRLGERRPGLGDAGQPATPPAKGERYTDPLPGATMVFVKGGTFTMGCQDGRDSNCEDDEKPAHQVTLNDFYIGETEVTQKQWRAVMGEDPPELRFKGCDDCPVENVSWNDIRQFLQKLNARSGGARYRLPTEAEWEYAARGGARSKGYRYAGGNTLGAVAWYDGNAGSKTHPVKGNAANELGLYDMSGNVREWCADWYGDYPEGPVKNPTGAASGVGRVIRGGSWSLTPRHCRAAYRGNNSPGFRINGVGFRLAASPQ